MFPGGLLSTTYLRVVVEEMIVDVLGVVEANGTGYLANGNIYYQSTLLKPLVVFICKWSL